MEGLYMTKQIEMYYELLEGALRAHPNDDKGHKSALADARAVYFEGLTRGDELTKNNNGLLVPQDNTAHQEAGG
jgi:hypothetical protein